MNPRQIRLPSLSHARPSLQRNASSSHSTSSRTSSASSKAKGASTSSLSSSSEVPDSTEEAWFWLSSQFFIDLSPSDIDAEQGWQYARSFNEIDENWSSEIPIEVVRILSGGELPSGNGKGMKWVRRRRWARIMRRRIDIPHWGFDDDDPPLSLSRSSEEGEGVGLVDGQGGDSEISLASRDYLERAQYFAGSHMRRNAQAHTSSGINDDASDGDEDTMSLRSMQTVIAEAQTGGEELGKASARRIVSRLERALQELHEGIEGRRFPKAPSAI